MTDTRVDVAALQHIYIGPSWARTDDGHWHLPEHTLGWQIAEWCATFLRAKDGGPWTFTLEQLRILLWWYAVDKHGRFIYRKGVIQRLKGWGKDPMLAVICLVEFVGPCRFAYWNADGTPHAVPHPDAWVQISAVNQAQTRNTMRLIPSLMSDLFIETYGVKPGAQLMRANNGRCHLEAVTSSYRALEGGRTTFTLLNETQHWVKGNNGHDMYDTIDNNAAKSDGGTARFLAITNAYIPGEDSVAEKMRTSYQAIVDGRAVDIGFMYDSIEAHPATPLTEDAMRIVIPIIRGDSVWLSVDSIIKTILDTQINPSRSRRMWLNQIVAGEDKLYGPADIDAIEDKKLRLRPGEAICLGFDGGRNNDSTALIGIRVSDGAAFVLGVWERPPGPERWEVPREEVDARVREVKWLYDVQAFFADVAYWESYVDDWAADFGNDLKIKASERHAVAWDMRQAKRATLAHERLMQTILDCKIKFDGNADLARHMLNAVRRTNTYGVGFGKETRDSPRKVDLYAALMLAHEALHELRVRKKPEKVRSGRGYFF